MIIGTIGIQMAKQELATAHDLWDQGATEKAVAEYDRLARTNLSIFPVGDQSLMLERAIDHYASSGQNTKAEKLVEIAVENEVGVDVSHPLALTMLSDHRKRIEQEQLAKQRANSKSDSNDVAVANKAGQNSSNQNFESSTDSPVASKKTIKISKGGFLSDKFEVTFNDNEVELSGFKLGKSYRLSFFQSMDQGRLGYRAYDESGNCIDRGLSLIHI